MTLQAAGAPGTVDAKVDVAFDDLGAEGTRISYEADATVGGMVGGVGQRMLGSVSKRMAGEFFGNVADALAAPGVPAGNGGAPDGSAAAAGASGAVYAPPPRSPSSQQDFVRGIAVGAGLV